MRGINTTSYEVDMSGFFNASLWICGASLNLSETNAPPAYDDERKSDMYPGGTSRLSEAPRLLKVRTLRYMASLLGSESQPSYNGTWALPRDMPVGNMSLCVVYSVGGDDSTIRVVQSAAFTVFPAQEAKAVRQLWLPVVAVLLLLLWLGISIFFLFRSPGNRMGEIEALISPPAEVVERVSAALVSIVQMPQLVVLTLFRRTVPHAPANTNSLVSAFHGVFRALALDFSALGLVPGLFVFLALWAAYYLQRAVQTRVLRGGTLRSEFKRQRIARQRSGSVFYTAAETDPIDILHRMHELERTVWVPLLLEALYVPSCVSLLAVFDCSYTLNVWESFSLYPAEDKDGFVYAEFKDQISPHSATIGAGMLQCWRPTHGVLSILCFAAFAALFVARMDWSYASRNALEPCAPVVPFFACSAASVQTLVVVLAVVFNAEGWMEPLVVSLVSLLFLALLLRKHLHTTPFLGDNVALNVWGAVSLGAGTLGASLGMVAVILNSGYASDDEKRSTTPLIVFLVVLPLVSGAVAWRAYTRATAHVEDLDFVRLLEHGPIKMREKCVRASLDYLVAEPSEMGASAVLVTLGTTSQDASLGHDDLRRAAMDIIVKLLKKEVDLSNITVRRSLLRSLFFVPVRRLYDCFKRRSSIRPKSTGDRGGGFRSGSAYVVPDKNTDDIYEKDETSGEFDEDDENEITDESRADATTRERRRSTTVWLVQAPVENVVSQCFDVMVVADFSCRGLGDDEAGIIASILPGHARLSELYLGGNVITVAGASKLMEALVENQTVRRCDMSNNALTCAELFDCSLLIAKLVAERARDAVLSAARHDSAGRNGTVLGTQSHCALLSDVEFGPWLSISIDAPEPPPIGSGAPIVEHRTNMLRTNVDNVVVSVKIRDYDAPFGELSSLLLHLAATACETTIHVDAFGAGEKAKCEIADALHGRVFVPFEGDLAVRVARIMASDDHGHTVADGNEDIFSAVGLSCDEVEKRGHAETETFFGLGALATDQISLNPDTVHADWAASFRRRKPDHLKAHDGRDRRCTLSNADLDIVSGVLYVRSRQDAQTNNGRGDRPGSLRTVDVSGHHIGLDESQRLLRGLRGNKSLRSLRLGAFALPVQELRGAAVQVREGQEAAEEVFDGELRRPPTPLLVRPSTPQTPQTTHFRSPNSKRSMSGRRSSQSGGSPNAFAVVDVRDAPVGLRIVDMGLRDADMLLFTALLRDNHTLRKLEIFSTDPTRSPLLGALGDRGMDLLAEVICKHSDTLAIRKLVLGNWQGGNAIGPRGAGSIGRAVASLPSLLSLDLRNNLLGNTGDDGRNGAELLCEALCGVPSDSLKLRSLKLGRNDIGDAGGEALAKLLLSNSSLTKVELSSSLLGVRGCTAIADSLRDNESLLTLCLDWNPVGDLGCVALGEMLQSNVTLRSLSLYNANIGPEGIDSLSQGLEENAALSELSVAMNDSLGDAGATEVAALLRENCSLTALNLSGCCIGDSGAVALADALLYSNRTLNTLDLTQNVIGDLGSAAFVELFVYFATGVLGGLDALASKKKGSNDGLPTSTELIADGSVNDDATTTVTGEDGLSNDDGTVCGDDGDGLLQLSLVKNAQAE